MCVCVCVCVFRMHFEIIKLTASPRPPPFPQRIGDIRARGADSWGATTTHQSARSAVIVDHTRRAPSLYEWYRNTRVGASALIPSHGIQPGAVASARAIRPPCRASAQVPDADRRTCPQPLHLRSGNRVSGTWALCARGSREGALA